MLVKNHKIPFCDIGEDALYAEENNIKESF